MPPKTFKRENSTVPVSQDTISTITPTSTKQNQRKNPKEEPQTSPREHKTGAPNKDKAESYNANFFQIHNKQKEFDTLVYQSLREQKKSELLFKVKELRFVQIKERYFDALIRIYDMNVARYFHYNPETLPYTVLGILLIFIGNLFINMSFTQNMVSLQLNIPPQIVATNTVLACAISGIVNCFISFRTSDTEVFDLIAGMNGLIVGYVSITSCCHNVESWAALVIGAFGSML